MEIEKSESDSDMDIDEEPKKKVGAKKKPFAELSERQKRNRLKNLKETINVFCSEEQVDFYTLIGYLGKDTYLEKKSEKYDYKKGMLFKEISENKDVFEQRYLSPQEALYLQETLQLGKSRMSKMKQFMDKFVHIPNNGEIRKYRKNLLPKLEKFQTNAFHASHQSESDTESVAESQAAQTEESVQSEQSGQSE